jgi:monoamine oxidase
MFTKHSYGTAENSKVLADAEQFLNELGPVFPGISMYWNGKAACGMSHLDPLFKSSYAFWRVGQYQTIAGYERIRQGNVFFAGEHTSLDYQGWLEGAASEGVRAAKEIVALYK